MNKEATVLVVEDILSARETVIHLMRTLGFSSFVEAENGAVALEKLAEHKVGLIISDWNMPRMNGMALLKEVRNSSKWKNIPFIFLTSKSEIEDVALASDVGVSGYLVKPVTIKALADSLAKVFERTFEEEFESIQHNLKSMAKEGGIAAAEKVLRKMIDDYPNYSPRILFELSRLYMDVRDYEHAEAVICDVLVAMPMFSKGWEMLAKVRSWQAKWEEALVAADKAISISPNNTDYYLLRGSINLHREDMHEAKKSFMIALNIDRKNDQVKQDIWNAYIDMDLVDEVQSEFGSYIFAALTCDTLNNMAVAYRRKGELGRAIETYRHALTKEPDNPKILFNAAVAYMNRKQYAKAISLLEHALGNDPEFEQAQKLLVQIEKTVKKNLEGSTEAKEEKEEE